MHDNNIKKWNIKRAIIGCASTALVIAIVLVALGTLAPEAKIDKHIEQEKQRRHGVREGNCRPLRCAVCAYGHGRGRRQSR